MRPFATTLLMGIAFSSGMLVPLIGLHATEDFERLEPLGAIIWGDQRIETDQVVRAGEFVGATGLRPAAADASAARDEASPAAHQPATIELAAAAPAVDERFSALDHAATGPRAELDGIAPRPASTQGDLSQSDSLQSEPLSKGDVAEIQTLLLIRGFNPGPIDGVMGTQTKQAIRAFERSQELPETGEATALQALLAGAGASRTVARNDAVPATQEASVQAAAANSAIGGNAPIRLVP